jgi:hypothetical protein
VPEIIRADRRLTIREVAEEVRKAFGTCQKILTENLRLRHVTAKFVPRLLTAEQKDDRVSVCTDLSDRAQNDPNLMSSVITGDECWVYRYDPETKQMSSQWSTSTEESAAGEVQYQDHVDCVLQH